MKYTFDPSKPNAQKYNGHSALTKREKEVLTQLHEGKSYRDVSLQLGVGIEAIRKHASNIYAKLDVKNRMQACRKYFG